MPDVPTHRSEQTGNSALDRIQNNVRDLVAFTKQLLARVVGLENGHGKGQVAVIPIADKDIEITPEQFACAFWVFTGTLAATRHVLVPRGTAKVAWARLAKNDTSGGFSVQLDNDDGFVVLASGTVGLAVAREGSLEEWL